MDALPDKFDVVVVGTGLVESMVAGACARVGKSVLHLDTHDFYGARNATFNLRQMCSWLRDPSSEDDASPLDSGSTPSRSPGTEETQQAADFISVHPSSYQRATRVSFIGGHESAQEAETSLMAQSVQYGIDLSPQLLLCAGSMIDLLRNSGVANYLEFKPMGSHLYCSSTQEAGPLRPPERVPCSKGDIFQSSSIPLLHKRQLMKFLQSCLALQPGVDETSNADADAQSWLAGRAVKSAAAPDAPPTPVSNSELQGSFAEFARRQKLPDTLLDVALFAILQNHRRLQSVSDGPSAEEGVRGVCRHLKSLGVYGPTAYLANCYGSSEVPQAFCRLCAVWGGTYMIHRRLLSIELKSSDSNSSDRVEAVVTSEGRVACDWLLLNADSHLDMKHSQERVPSSDAPAQKCSTIARCVCILDQPLLGEAGEELNLTTFFPSCDEPGARTVFVLQQDAGVAVCPKGKVLVHLIAEGCTDRSPEEILQPVLQQLVGLAASRSSPPEAAETAGAADQTNAPSAAECDDQSGSPGAADAAIGSNELERHDCGASSTACMEQESLEESNHDNTTTATTPSVPQILWGAFFELPLRRCVPEYVESSLPPNLLAVDDLPLSLNTDTAAERAQQLFESICPDKPFLPSLEDFPPELSQESDSTRETPKFIDTSFSTKAEYETWLKSGEPLPQP